jgi:phage gp16-like protein
MNKIAPDHRNADIAKIQIARRQLNLPDDEYRAILSKQGNGATSSSELDHDGRFRVIAYFQRLGWKPKATPVGSSRRQKRPTPSVDALPLVRRIRAQLISLDRKSDSYADGISRQMYGVELYEWCTPDQLQAITAALSVQQRNLGASER